MRVFLYHSTYPDGKIFTDRLEYMKALRDHWVEAPWLVEKPDCVEVEVVKNGDKPNGKRAYKRRASSVKHRKPKRDPDGGGL